MLLTFQSANAAAFQASSLFGWNNTNYYNVTPCSWSGVTCYNGRVSSLILNGIGLTVLPDILFQNLTFVNYFDLSNNAFSGPLSSSISNLGSSLINFMLINLSSNSFSGPIPTSITGITNLHMLNLSNNAFTGPMPTFGNMAGLWSLDISHNNFGTQLDPTIGNLNMLNYLSVRNCGLVGALPVSFANLVSLAYIDLSFNQFNSSLPSMSLFNQLQYFNAQNCSFTGQIPSRFRTYTNTLILSGNNFGCPIPPCSVGYPCTLGTLTIPCTCNCGTNGACVWGIDSCVCNSNYYGPVCTNVCPGLVTVDGVELACSGHGTCSDGWNGTGLCVCDTALGYGGSDCSQQCYQQLINGSLMFCGGKGLCVNGACQCTGNFGGVNCIEACVNGWAGVSEGCKIECRGGSSNPCNGNGQCQQSDGSCVCNRNYYGDSCQSEEPVGLISGLVVLAFFILLGVSIGAFFWWRRYRVDEERDKYLEAKKVTKFFQFILKAHLLFLKNRNEKKWKKNIKKNYLIDKKLSILIRKNLSKQKKYGINISIWD